MYWLLSVVVKDWFQNQQRESSFYSKSTRNSQRVQNLVPYHAMGSILSYCSEFPEFTRNFFSNLFCLLFCIGIKQGTVWKDVNTWFQVKQGGSYTASAQNNHRINTTFFFEIEISMVQRCTISLVFNTKKSREL